MRQRLRQIQTDYCHEMTGPKSITVTKFSHRMQSLQKKRKRKRCVAKLKLLCPADFLFFDW